MNQAAKEPAIKVQIRLPSMKRLKMLILIIILSGRKALFPLMQGNPWNGSWVYNHGNLIADLLDNLVLESTGVLQKTRIYEMSSNQTFRETLAFLIVRDNAHQNAFAKALETLGLTGRTFFLCRITTLINIPSAESLLN